MSESVDFSSVKPSDDSTTNTANPSQNVHKIIEEFQYLLEKSQQLFAGLRDLPPTGRNWQPYFQRTFEVYTKLWKFQQTHRSTLEHPEYYGLKRWEIGEMASKIGQLYYHYYLRTSETNYLHEAFIFYEAIRERSYFRDVLLAKSAPLMIKKLRYYARFIVVCLLLNKNDMIKKLMDELTNLVEEYTSTFKPTDAAEWSVVLSEISTFLEAEKKLTPMDADGTVLSVPGRLQVERSTRVDKDGQVKLKLQEAILVGNYQNQIKFSELTLDMYRMLQSLEREPMQGNAQKPSHLGGASTSSAGTSAVVPGETSVSTTNPSATGEAKEGDESDKGTRRVNPHKYLLYRPTLAQLMLYIATGFKDLTENSAMLLYISADGSKVKRSDGDSTAASNYTGGIATAVNYTRKNEKDKLDVEQNALTHTLHPADLITFSRKALFVVVDSNNSVAFKSFQRVFNQPFVCLMSPVEYPSSIKDTTQIGSLFTLFLHAPAKAFAFISDMTQVSGEVWNNAVSHINATEKFIIDLMESELNLDKAYKRFMQDDFLRSFIVRFIFATAIISSHVSFKDSKHLPSSYPPIPQTLLGASEILSKVKELVTITGTTQFYNFEEPAPETTA